MVLITRAATDFDGSSAFPLGALIIPLATVIYLLRTSIIEAYGWLEHEVWAVRAAVLSIGFVLSLVLVLTLPRALQAG